MKKRDKMMPWTAAGGSACDLFDYGDCYAKEKAAKAAEATAAKRKEAAAARRHTEKTKQATTRAGRAGPPSPIAIPPLQSPPPENVERVRTRSVG